MSTNLLREVRLADEPRILCSQSLSSSAQSISTGIEIGRPVLSAVTEMPRIDSTSCELNTRVQEFTGIPDTTVAILSYEEYKQRYAEDIEESRQQARAEGFSQGKQEGILTAEKEYQQQLASLRAAILSAQASQQRGIDSLADMAVEIVYVAVVKILGETLVNKEHAIAAVREVIRRCKDRSRLLVRVASGDVKMLNALRTSLLEGLNAAQLEIIADELVELGGCVLDSPSGNLDGRLETQLQRLREILMQSRTKWGEGDE